jgi:hypothetical protein
MDLYRELCLENVAKDGAQMVDPHGDERGRFRWGALLARLDSLSKILEGEGGGSVFVA